MIRKTSLLIISCAVLLLSATSLQAGTHDKSRVDDATRKLGRGISNVVFAPIEIFNSIYTVQQEDGEVAAISYGLLQGVGRSALRIGIGVYEVATFPKAEAPLIMPEFPARAGILSTIMEPGRRHDYPESDEFQFPPDRRRHSHLRK